MPTELKKSVWHLMLLCVLMTPFPPRSSKYLIHINSVILTTVQPETVDGKFNPLVAERRESLWKIQCMIDSHAKGHYQGACALAGNGCPNYMWLVICLWHLFN